jgi:hypothetical protein
MMMIDGRYCRGVARAYHAAFLQVERYINVEFIISYYERFGFLSVSTPEEKAEWINAWVTYMEESMIYYHTRRFLDSMKQLLEFHDLELAYHLETDKFTCDFKH